MSASGQASVVTPAAGSASSQRRPSEASPTAPAPPTPSATTVRTPKPAAAGATTKAAAPAPSSGASQSSAQATPAAQPAARNGKARQASKPLPLPILLGGVASVAAGLLTLLLRRRRSRHGSRKPATDGRAAAVKGPCSKLKPTAKCVPLADGSACVIRREIPADNSCLFNGIGYVMHKSKTRAPHLRNVVAQQVAGDRATYSDAFLGMSNEAYCSWIRQPYNWGGGIELSILAQAYSMEIAAWNIESCKEHVFGEESGYKRQAMVIYNGVHYDALAVATSPRANPDDDETTFNPRTKRGKMILAAARKLTALAHKESAFHGAAKKQPAATAAASSSSSSSAAAPKQNGTGADAAADGQGAPKAARPAAATRRVPRVAAAASAAAAAAAAATSSRLACGDCGEVLCGSAAAAEHAKATGHQSYKEVAA